MSFVKLLSLLGILCNAVAFVPTCRVSSRRSLSVAFQGFASQREPALDFVPKVAAAAGLSMGAFFFQVGAALAAEELEIAELPPPIVPLLFGVGILAGVGVLTSSLGDVYSEESALGMQSGARAKKERERSRSSYFKK